MADDRDSSSAICLSAERLTALAMAMLAAAGAPSDRAATCARHLVSANLRGHDSHGIGMTSSYLRWILGGRIDPSASAEIVHDAGAVVMVDGRFGLGQVVAAEAMAIAIARAKVNGIACVGLRNACHVGRVGAYAELCADAGLVSIHHVNVVGHGPVALPYGGRDPRTVTNPYCSAIPRADGAHLVLDFATTTLSTGKLRTAYLAGESAPPGAITDADGRPTEDLGVLFESSPRGHLLPFGLYKGGGLQVMCELLGGALAGHWTMQPGSDRDFGATVNNMLTIVLDPAAFGDVEAYEQEAEAMIAYLRATPPAAGFDRVRLPGDPEREAMTLRLRAGVPIDRFTWADLTASAASVGVDAMVYAIDGSRTMEGSRC